MSAAGALGDIRSALAKKADARYREQIQRLVPGVRTLGVRVPDIRAIAAAFAKANRDLDLGGACDILDAACRAGSRDEMLAGCFVVARFRRALKDLAWPRILGWLKAVDNWETCDQIAMGIAAPVIAANPARLSDLAKLTGDRRVWARRFAMAAAAALNQRGRDIHVGGHDRDLRAAVRRPGTHGAEIRGLGFARSEPETPGAGAGDLARKPGQDGAEDTVRSLGKAGAEGPLGPARKVDLPLGADSLQRLAGARNEPCVSG